MSASTACPAVRSCQKPRAPLAATITRMINPSLRSPRAIDSTVAATRITTIGLVNWATSSRSPRCGCATSMALGPSRARRRAASAADRPSAVAAVAARSRSWGNDQNASVPDVGVACAEGLMLPAS